MFGDRLERTAWRAAALLAAALCVAKPAHGQQGPRPTPGPQGAVTLDAAGKEALLRYAQGLQFATSVTATDEQRLIVYRGGQPYLGPWMSIQPEIGSGALDRAALAEGRIIARVLMRRAPQSVTAYWYVDSVSAGWRSAWIVDDPRWSVILGQLAIHQHPDTVWYRGRTMLPRSRIVVEESGGDSTAVCTLCPNGWCRDPSYFMSLAPVIGALTSGAIRRSSTDAAHPGRDELALRNRDD